MSCAQSGHCGGLPAGPARTAAARHHPRGPAGRHDLQSLSVALAGVAVSPWLPLVVASPHSRSGSLRFDVGGACLHAITLQLRQGEALEASVLCAVVRARRKPTAAELVEFVSRTHGAAVAPLLAKALRGTPLKRSEHAKLRAATGLGAEAWEKLHECLGCIADCWRDPRSVEALADAHKVSPKTVWGRCQRCFGMTWRSTRATCSCLNCGVNTRRPSAFRRCVSIQRPSSR